MSNNTSLYSTTSSGNVTIPPNNNTGLYVSSQVIPVENDISITGNISAAGNITGGNLISQGIITAAGNIYAANFVGNIVGNLIVPGSNTQVIYNDSGNAGASAAFTFNSASNVVSVTGNVAASYFIGDGSQLTNLPAGNYSNANATALMAAFGSNVVSTTGNVTAGFFLGDGSQLTNLPAGNYSNANVAAYLPTYTGNLTANVISASGNVTGAFILGDGSQLTNLPAGNYSNANVSAFLPVYTGNISAVNINALGNVQGNYFVGNGSQLTGITVNYSNANVTSLLAAFGSNVISGTGNITAARFSGNGAGLTSITGANVTGTVANATFATSSGTAATVTTNAQPNITSLGTLTTVTSTGNVTGGNILTGGTISAAGNVTGNYIIGDGSQLTNLPLGNYSNANVANYLPVFTGNITAGNISATGNITGNFLKTSGVTGNIVGVNYVSANFYLGDGGLLSNIQAANLVGAYSNANVANYLPTFSGNITANTISATGNVTGNYILGNGSQLTGITTAAGGSNTQIQFNDGTVFAGNTNMTFNKVTGDITLGNIAYNGLRVLPGNTSNLDIGQVASNVTPWQIRLGGSFNGNSNWAYDLFGPGNVGGSGPATRVAVSDVYNVGNSAARWTSLGAQNWVNLTANVTNANTRWSGLSSIVGVGGGSAGNTWLSSQTFALSAVFSAIQIGNVNGANTQLGNTTANYAIGQGTTFIMTGGSTVNYGAGMISNMQFAAGTGNIGNSAAFFGYYPNQFGNTDANTVQATNVATFYTPGPTTSIWTGAGQGNIARMATNYHAFRNDDDLAKTRLGSLERYHYFTANTGSSGTVTINKNSGQYQNIYPTGNITIGSFTNFVTRVQRPNNDYVNQSDVVTLLIQQGATPWTITMPTGNANILYANGVSTVANTANAITRITITGIYNYNVGANQYLIDITPEYTTV